MARGPHRDRRLRARREGPRSGGSRRSRGSASSAAPTPTPPCARALADAAPATGGPVPAFADHAELIRQATPDALAVFTPHLAHYRPTIDGLQAGCDVFVEKPLSTNVQEAVDVVNVARARGARSA